MITRENRPRNKKPYFTYQEFIEFKHPLTGKIKKRAKTFKTPAEANAWKKKMRVEKYKYEASAHLTFQESIKRYLT